MAFASFKGKTLKTPSSTLYLSRKTRVSFKLIKEYISLKYLKLQNFTLNIFKL